MGGGNKRIQANCDAAFLCPSPGQDEGKRMKDLEASLSYIVRLSQLNSRSKMIVILSF